MTASIGGSGIGIESIVRPFIIQTNPPQAPAATQPPLPGEGASAFISWGATSDFQDLSPQEDMQADNQCSGGVGYEAPSIGVGVTAATSAPSSTTTGPATTGTRAQASPSGATAQTLNGFWGDNGYTQTNNTPGTNDFWTADPTTKTVTWHPDQTSAQAQADSLNSAKSITINSAAAKTAATSSFALQTPSGTDTIGDPTGGVAIGGTSPAATKTPTKKAPQDNKPGIDSLSEIDRWVETITVYKPNDNTVWVNVQRILSIRFRQANGRILKLNMKPPPAPPRPASSS